MRRIARARVGRRAPSASTATRVVVPLTAPERLRRRGVRAGRRSRPTWRAASSRPRAAVADAFGYASGAFAFDLELAPGGARDVYLAVPFGAADASIRRATRRHRRGRGVRGRGARLARAARRRRASTCRRRAQAHADAVRTAAAQVLVNRDGPALQPGPRRYTRSWIRDGAIMAAALLRVGRARRGRRVRPLVRDVPGAGRQRAVLRRSQRARLARRARQPRRADLRGRWSASASPATARSSPSCGRRCGGRSTTSRRLRATRLGPEFETAELRARRGLLPESASHEGYLAHPVHSYWDDFWALQGYRDAAAMAAVLGDDGGGAAHRAPSRDVFRAALRASIERTIADRGIDYVPGSVEWADFDPTATANAVALLGGVDDLPRGGARSARSTSTSPGSAGAAGGEIDWNNYSAYEIRIVGALVQLGRARRRGRADGVPPGRPASARVEPVAGDLLARPAQPGTPRRRAAHVDRRRVRPRVPQHARLRAGGRPGARARGGRPGVLARRRRGRRHRACPPTTARWTCVCSATARTRSSRRSGAISRCRRAASCCGRRWRGGSRRSR